ncbi:hypothetical protein REJC140_04030 [Pseudorhizobium endolithicum]|uniref:Uncharacterized protein n=1 Tax=Pseudorhizobium endolithicum TaxID=1191678 RepID=A0ABN7JSL2_9HYPH|nr:hypothetical protein [Pseudorhizobium endolithicum]CAD6415721.1 hypothetical protein REQ54_01478 [Rhizobium sp. Q54]CAD7045970.1 hypothetical protein REJC140_04030 [Pseudorhizobium endolithicum]
MRRSAPYCLLIVAAALALMSFRLDRNGKERESLLYDVRAAFVAAWGDVPHPLVAKTDRLVNEAILSTVRTTPLPRAVLAVRIEAVDFIPTIVGVRRSATVTVEAIAVANGDVIAQGTFDVSAHAIRKEAVDGLLAERIAARIGREFKLELEPSTAFATALIAVR